jgi:hypothetical protein
MRIALALVVLASASCAPAAHAAGTGERPPLHDHAVLLFEQGRALMIEEHYVEACPKFAESLRLDLGVGVSLWLAQCYEETGKLAHAWAQFRDAAALASRRGDERAKVATQRAAALVARVPRLAVVVPRQVDVEGLHVERDGVVVPCSEWGLPMPVDPGPHAISVTAPRMRPWRTEVEVPRGSWILVKLPRLETEALPLASW